MTRFTIAAALSCILFALSPSLASAQGSADDPVVAFAPEDGEMNAAISRALATLDLFFEHALAPDGMAIDGAFVKVAVATDPGSSLTSEHVWVGPFARRDGMFVGVLMSDPVHFSNFAMGDLMSFSRDQISDWGLMGSDGLRYGHYTSRVVTTRLPSAEAAAYEGIFSANPLPIGWE